MSDAAVAAETRPLSLAQEIEKRVARYADRREDWTVFGFETQLDPRFARSQRRYIGASGSVDHTAEQNAVKPTAFTMSIQTMPAGNKIPVHRHETEETFFILSGSCIVNVYHDGETVTVKLNSWDLITVPAMVYHDIHNEGTEDCAVQTLLAKALPNRPDYRDPDLLELQAKTYTS